MGGKERCLKAVQRKEKSNDARRAVAGWEVDVCPPPHPKNTRAEKRPRVLCVDRPNTQEQMTKYLSCFCPEMAVSDLSLPPWF